MKTAQEQLIDELAENGTDRQRELFLKYQQEVNQRIKSLANSIGLLAIGTVHMIGSESAQDICQKMEQVKSSLK